MTMSMNMLDVIRTSAGDFPTETSLQWYTGTSGDVVSGAVGAPRTMMGVGFVEEVIPF